MDYDFPVHQFPGDDVTYITPTWKDLQNLTFDLSEQMRASGRSFERIVTLAKGGWPMTRCLVDFLGVHEVASIGVKFYAGIHARLDQPRIYQDMPVAVIDERVLLFDDVADTGSSLKFTYDYLLHYRGVRDVATATLFTKPHSVIRPDYSGAETKAWIVFPYDAAEMISVVGKRWKELGVPNEEIAKRFTQLGFEKIWIDTYMEHSVAPAGSK